MSAATPLLFALPGNQVLTERLALALDAEVGELSTREFPDCETYIRLETDPAGRDVAVVGTLARPNDKILPMLFVAGAAHQLGAARVGIVAPYLPYMRQDAQFHPGEAVTARLFADVLSLEADWLLTIDPHLHRITRLSEIFHIDTTTVHTTDLLGSWIAAHVSQPLIVGPDDESRQWAADVGAAANAPCVVVHKDRRGDEDVVVTFPDLAEYEGRTPVLVDDIISTGRTMLAALEQLRLRLPGCPAPICVGVHALFGSGVHDALRAAGAARIVTTNSIPHPSNAVDVVPALAEAWMAAITHSAQPT
jgi:ribose-phosphate pyrophosphokinase